MPSRATHAVGIDTGGTFTDAVARGTAGRLVAKVPSTPEAPEEGFLAALAAVGGQGARVRHGTTVATNTVLTRAGARVVLLVSEGFEDLPWLGRGTRDDLHALTPSRTSPLVAATVGVHERRDARGKVVMALEPAELERACARVAATRPDAIAICLLHALQSGVHERRLARALRELGVPIYLSSRTGSDSREGERAATSVLDAYVGPALTRYLDAVRRGLTPAARKHLTVMRSDGGRMAVRDVARAPARTLVSGPAAGVSAAQDLARRHGLPRVLSFDVGGTSTDVAWIEGDDLPVSNVLHVGPHAASVPAVGIETVGAGGGSVVSIDAGGALRVGPQSAGAQPGPAAYGHGGPFALTDAWLLLGRTPSALLGGAFPLDKAASERAGRVLARRAGVSLPQLCAGVVAVAAAATARALRLASVAHGHDPRTAALIAFGGAGPGLAAETATQLGIQRVLVPRGPGTFAAEGALRAPLRADASEVLTPGRAADLSAVRARLEASVRAILTREHAAGIVTRAELDARYAGQAFTVSTPLRRGWQRAFHGAHAQRYGFSTPDRPVEAVRVHVRGAGRDGPRVPDPRVARVRVHRVRGDAVARTALRPGARLRGPARIDERSGTTWVSGGWCAHVLGDGTLALEPGR